MKIQVFGFTKARHFAAIAILASFVFSNVFASGQLNADKSNVITTSTAMAATPN